MASLFDYVQGNAGPVGMGFAPGSVKKQRPVSSPMSGGYTWTGSRHDGGVRPINQLNRNQVNLNRLNKFGSIGGGGRSNLDAARGKSMQGIAGLNQRPWSATEIGATTPGATVPDDEYDFEDRGFLRNIAQDATRMATDLTPDVNMPNIPGIGGILQFLGGSIGQNQKDHKVLNAAYGRASPEKNASSFPRPLL